MTDSFEKSGGQPPKIANTKQLLFAIGLGAVVVVLYNVQVNRIRNENTADMVQKLTYKVEKQPGEILKAEDMEVVDVPRSTAQYLTAVKDASQRTAIDGKPVLRKGNKGSFIVVDDLEGEQANRPSTGLHGDNEEVSLPLDPTVSLGRALRMGDKVNVWAMMPDGKSGYKVTKVIGGLQVRTIGGIPLGTAQPSRRADDEGVLSYRQIGVEVSRDQVDKLYNVRTWAQTQQFWVTLRSEVSSYPDDGRLNPELEKYWSTASAGKTGN